VRLDARRELLAEVRAKGQPAGEEPTDEELLLQCWNIWGEAALQKIAGDFSFALWDAEKQSPCCARDFAGARPFYYAQAPGVFYFSNTLQVLRKFHRSPAIRTLSLFAIFSSKGSPTTPSAPCGAACGACGPDTA
jgi:asparagine synthetase B (glutamine-hydrolysing)